MNEVELYILMTLYHSGKQSTIWWRNVVARKYGWEDAHTALKSLERKELVRRGSDIDHRNQWILLTARGHEVAEEKS